MGARAHMSPRLMQILPEHLDFGYIGRPERASPGEGYPAAHIAEQNRIIQHRAGPVDARSRCTRRRRRASASAGLASAPAARRSGAISGARRPSSSRQPGCSSIARRTQRQPALDVARPGPCRGRPRTAARGCRAPARAPRRRSGAGVLVAALAHRVVGLVGEVVGLAARRAGGAAPPAARGGPRRAARRAATPRPSPARRAAPRTGGRGRRRPRPRRRRARPSGARASEPVGRLEGLAPSRPSTRSAGHHVRLAR